MTPVPPQQSAERQLEEALDENARLMAALNEIADPIAAMRSRAEALGRQLEGHMAYLLSNDPHYLKQIASTTLSEAKTHG